MENNKKYKKILFVITTLVGGGAEKALVNLVNNLDYNKYEITVMTLFDYGVNKKYLNENVKYKYIFKRKFKGGRDILRLFNIKFLYRNMIKGEYDIVISFFEGPTTRIVGGCDDKSVKLINWVHTGIENVKQLSKAYRNIEEMKKVYSKFDETIFVSNSAKERFIQKVGMENLHSQVIRNIVDVKNIEEKSREELNDFRFENTNKKVLAIGRLVRTKGYDRLLRIHKELIEEGYRYSLYILGEGSEKKRLEKYIKNNNIEKYTFLLGYDENPYKYLKNSDFFVCSSYREGYSTTVVESIILGTPVIVTSCSGMNEILDNGKYGVIVDNNEKALKEAIKNFLDNPKEIEKCKELAKERSEYLKNGNPINEIEKLLDM